jgi:hypothetical protein
MKQKPTMKEEDVMNKIQIILAAIMIMGGTTLTQAQKFFPDLKKYSAGEKEVLDMSYANLLNARDNEYIEHTLAIVTMIKLDLPADQFPKIQNKIDTIVAQAATPTIQYRAALAKEVFAHTAIFKEEAGRQYATTDALFSAIAERTGKVSVTSNSTVVFKNNEK